MRVVEPNQRLDTDVAFRAVVSSAQCENNIIIVRQNEMKALKKLWWFVLCTALFACEHVSANSECLFYGHAVAKVEKTEKGNLFLRLPHLLIYLHPNDFDTFSPYVGKWINVPRFYSENETDKPPEAVKPGDVFSAPGVRLIEVLPDPPLGISVHLTKNHYQIGETITVEIQLRNTTSGEVKLYTRQSDDPRFKSRVPIIISVSKVGKWHKLEFYDVLHSKGDSPSLSADELLVENDIDISGLIEGAGRYRVSAIYSGSFRTFSQLVDLTISREHGPTRRPEKSTEPGTIGTKEDYPWPKYEMKDFATFTEYFDAMIPHITSAHDPSNARKAYQHFKDDALRRLRIYLSHEHYRVRLLAYQHLFTFLRQEESLEKRQEYFEAYLSGLQDSEGVISQSVARRMNTFGADIFNTNSKMVVISYLKAGPKSFNPFGHIILAAGLIKAQETIPLLEKLDDNVCSHFALARMGREDSLARVLGYFPEKPETRHMTPRMFWRLKLLAYTKQPQATKVLRNYLYADVVRPGGNDYPAESLAGWAAEALIDVIGTLPIEPHQARTPASIRACKKWLKKNLNKKRLPDLLSGEIERWNNL